MTEKTEWDVSTAQLLKTHGYSAKTDYHKETARARETIKLAQEILRIARNILLIHLRFMESALVRFIPGDDTITPEIATDGQFLYYNSTHICRKFQSDKQQITRDYLHLTLHCIFRHLFVGKQIHREIWDLSCDIAVENMISELHLDCLSCNRQEKQGWLITKLKQELPFLTAERIFYYFLNQDIPPQEFARLREWFYADDHTIWYNDPETSSGQGDNRDNADNSDGEPDSVDQQGQEEEMISPDDADTAEDSSASGGLFTGEQKDSGDGEGQAGKENEQQQDKKALSPEETRQKWEEISRRIQVDLETFSTSWGENAGGFLAELAQVNREKVDYAGFLRRFAVLGENIEINDEEFDYIFYTYGLKLYEKMPLVEPLEYKEVKRVREFVIALDTSQSVSGDLIQAFVTKTWNILKQTENFFTKINVHILQCGAQVEEDAKITSQEEFDRYIDSMVLHGFGGTDFRPVFDHVNTLIRQHEFTNFKGLIYFTDGYGTFPAMMPDYETAFVFVDQGRQPPDVPVWAMKLILTSAEIYEL
ncbi:MAG: metallopeptidase [Ruminococcus sp.]|nr:metallopeptidase [Ruminococcus sp.]